MVKKLSIIVPVYNVEQYIEKCLNSLVNQTIKNYEIIIVIDGSTDDSEKIVKKYAKKYPNLIKYYVTKNNGLSAARNYGLEKATGEYVGFVDSDDYIELDMYEIMYNLAKKSNLDVVMCDYYKEMNEKTQITNLGISSCKSKKSVVLNSKPYAWNKLYKRSLFKKYNIKFPMGITFEDISTTYPIIFQTNKIGYINKPLYHYIYQRNDSIMRKKKRKDLDLLLSLNNLITYMKTQKLYDEYYDLIKEINVKYIYYRLRDLKGHNNIIYNFKFVDASFVFLNKNFNDWKKNTEFLKNKQFYKKCKIAWKFKILIGG